MVAWVTDSTDRAYVLHTTCMTPMVASHPDSKDLRDAFIKVSFQEDRESDPLMGHWLDQGLHPFPPQNKVAQFSPFVGSAKHSSPLVLL